MKVTRSFAPITIIIEAQEEKTYLLEILNAAYRDYERFRETDMMQRVADFQRQLLK